MPAGKLIRTELPRNTRDYRLPEITDEGLVKCDVVKRQQNRAQHFLRNEQMPQIRTAVASARNTAAFQVQWTVIPLVDGIS